MENRRDATELNLFIMRLRSFSIRANEGTKLWIQLLGPRNSRAQRFGQRMIQRSNGLALSSFMADTAGRLRHRRSSMRSNRARGWADTLMPPRRRKYIIAGTGTLYMEDGITYSVGPGSVFVVPTPVRHDLANTGKETLRAVAFFAAAMFTQNFDNVMLPPKSHILGTPNRDG